MEKAVVTKQNLQDYGITRFADKGTLLEYQGHPVFIVGSGVEVRDDFILRLIEAYGQSTHKTLS
jgi:hypothetical protein